MLEFDICFKDTNSGVEINKTVLATSKDLKAAMWISGALTYEWMSEKNQEIPIATDAKRVFFVQEREVEEIEGDDEIYE